MSTNNKEELIKGVTRANIEALVNKARTNGVAVLNIKNSNEYSSLNSKIKIIDDISMFMLRNDDDPIVVFKYKKQKTQTVDYLTELRKGKDLFGKGKYEECISLFRELIAIGKPKAWVFGYIGLAYIRTSKKKTGIDYLMVATAMSKVEKSNLDYTELIRTLKGDKITEEEKAQEKVKVRVKQKEFTNDDNDYYGIKEIQEISDLLNEGLSFDEACERLNITGENKILAILIFAKECYIQGYYISGDKYLKIVERTKNKSALSKKIYSEIKTNRDYYINRDQTNHKKLCITQKKN